MAVPEHKQTLLPMVLPMRFPAAPLSSPPGAGFDVRAAAPRWRGGVGARITAIILLPVAPVSQVELPPEQHAVTRPVDHRNDSRLRSPGPRGQGARAGREVEFQHHRRVGKRTDDDDAPG